MTGLRVSQVLTQASKSRRVRVSGKDRECVVCGSEISNKRVYKSQGMDRWSEVRRDPARDGVIGESRNRWVPALTIYLSPAALG